MENLSKNHVIPRFSSKVRGTTKKIRGISKIALTESSDYWTCHKERTLNFGPSSFQAYRKRQLWGVGGAWGEGNVTIVRKSSFKSTFIPVDVLNSNSLAEHIYLMVRGFYQISVGAQCHTHSAGSQYRLKKKNNTKWLVLGTYFNSIIWS